MIVFRRGVVYKIANVRKCKSIDEVVLCPRLVPLNDNDLLGDAKMKGGRIHSFSNTYSKHGGRGHTKSFDMIKRMSMNDRLITQINFAFGAIIYDLRRLSYISIKTEKSLFRTNCE